MKFIIKNENEFKLIEMLRLNESNDKIIEFINSTPNLSFQRLRELRNVYNFSLKHDDFKIIFKQKI